MSRVFKNKGNVITQAFKKGVHNGIDLVGTGYTLDYITAHSEGTVVSVRNNYKTNDKTGCSYGNYVKIKHNNGYYTLYAHMKYNSIIVKVGQKVSKGQIIGYMGNTGHSFGAHLHFEVRDKNDNFINPTYSNESKKGGGGGGGVDCDVLTVRTGPGTNYDWKKFNQLTSNAQAQIKGLVGYKANGLVRNCICDVSEVKGEWGKIPSGWICLKYCKKA